MSEADRERAEHNLRQLLERALLSVPFVRLDCVDEVTALFQQAINLLENNLDDVGSDDELPTSSSSHPSSKKVEGSHTSLLESATVGTAQNNVSPGHSPDISTQHNPVARPLPNKNLIGTRETKDYSSPRGMNRSLGSNSARPESAGNPATAPSAGLGLKKGPSSRAKSAVGAGGLGLRGVGPKPSSRVPMGTATRSEDDADADEEEDSSEEIDQGPTPPTTAQGLHHSTSNNAQPSGVNVTAIKNKLLGGAVKDFASREYPSPKMQARNLSGASTPEKPIAHEKPRPQITEDKPVTTDTTVYQSPAQKVREALAKTGEVIANKQLDKFMENNITLVEASPKQKQTSLLLMSLAKKDGDDTVSTPKAAYLRRLDSPDTHHGKLLQAKANLQSMINKALTYLPHLSIKAPHSQLQDAFEKAVKKLESSLVNPTPEFRG